MIAMLPGMGDDPEMYQQQGWTEALADTDIDADALLVDSHIGYVREGIVLERVQEDVIERAQEEGYEKIWFVGISMGGGLALSFATAETEAIAGLALFAPYPGQRSLLNEIKEAGGPHQWTPNYSEDQPREREDGGPTFRRVWEWLISHQYADGSEMPIYLHYGNADRGAPGFDLIAEVLPEDHVSAIEGNHKWTTWNVLWDEFLARDVLRESCGVIEATE
jgi:pimeloyl-ACP methyl ester carboxylesterase